jgi:hypothetical protein
MTALTYEQIAKFSRAVHDPGSFVGRRYGPAWPIGEDGYDTEQESLGSYQLRAVTTVAAELVTDHAALADAARAWRDARAEASALHMADSYAALREAGDQLTAAVAAISTPAPPAEFPRGTVADAEFQTHDGASYRVLVFRSSRGWHVLDRRKRIYSWAELCRHSAPVRYVPADGWMETREADLVDLTRTADATETALARVIGIVKDAGLGHWANDPAYGVQRLAAALKAARREADDSDAGHRIMDAEATRLHKELQAQTAELETTRAELREANSGHRTMHAEATRLKNEIERVWAERDTLQAEHEELLGSFQKLWNEQAREAGDASPGLDAEAPAAAVDPGHISVSVDAYRSAGEVSGILLGRRHAETTAFAAAFWAAVHAQQDAAGLCPQHGDHFAPVAGVGELLDVADAVLAGQAPTDKPAADGAVICKCPATYCGHRPHRV